jgi:hypothetical protein
MRLIFCPGVVSVETTRDELGHIAVSIFPLLFQKSGEDLQATIYPPPILVYT